MTAAAPWWRRCPDRESVQHVCQALRVDASGTLRCATPGCNRTIEGRIVRSRGFDPKQARPAAALAGVGQS